MSGPASPEAARSGTTVSSADGLAGDQSKAEVTSDRASVSASAAVAASAAARIPYERFLQCVHCGLCTAACPTYLETGNENDSPRGRIYLMRGVVDGRVELSERVRRHLELCLDCRSCETACPSGVRYGRLIEPFKVALHRSGGSGRRAGWFERFVLYGLFPHPRRMRRVLRAAWWLQRLRLDRVLEATGAFRLLPPRLRQMHRLLPRPLRLSEPPLPERLPARGRRRAVVGLFTGCVADALFRHVHWATARVLQENGCDVVVPRNQCCCGAIFYHSGNERPMRELIAANLEAFPADLDAVVVNVAGCGSMLKDYVAVVEEAPERPSGPASAAPGDVAAFVGRVRDVTEFLDELGIRPPRGPIPARAVYHDACHLVHAQGIRAAPRRLLETVPQLELVPLEESDICCGAAGSYNLTEVEMAERLGRRKAERIAAARPDVVVTANAGCQLQIAAHLRQRGLDVPVLHPVELLDLSYRGHSVCAR
ncbi:MAG: (Fe-S)-binding protein [Planctomycetota bacterium]|nr:MAG: (Fe-S)-binding protein [Planctomycetota bacterium]